MKIILRAYFIILMEQGGILTFSKFIHFWLILKSKNSGGLMSLGIHSGKPG